METEGSVKVLYIAGFERSGSTIVNRVLGQIDGFVAWGELRDVWEYGKIENRVCSCGAKFSQCESWSKILNDDFDKQVGIDAAEMLRLKKITRASTLLNFTGYLGRSVFQKLSADYLRGLEKLYRTIQVNTKSRVIVDSTKASWYGYVLSQLPCIDLYTIHVTRDPRGVCYSLQKRKESGEPECQWYNSVHASISWEIKNLLVEKLLGSNSRKYLRVRYEDFVCHPENIINSIMRFLEESPENFSLVDRGFVNMGTDHLFSGSPGIRSLTGKVSIENDERWKTMLSKKDEIIIKSLTLPLLLRYGYLGY